MYRVQARSQFRNQLLRQDFSRGADALISGITEGKIPPAVKILYQDWESHYRDDPHFSGVLPEVISATVAHGFVWSMGKVQNYQRIVVPVKALDKVIVSVHSYSHLGFRKTVEVCDRTFVGCIPNFLLLQPWNFILRVWLLRAIYVAPTGLDVVVILIPIILRPSLIILFSSVSMDFFSLPRYKHEATGEIFDDVYVILCRLTGYILAISCQQNGLATRKAAQLFVDRCVYFMGMPQSIYSDDQSIISNDFLSMLCELAGAEHHKTVLYPSQSNGWAERAVQSGVCSLRHLLEQRGKGKHNSWVTSLPLALWGLNDLPGAVHPYSPRVLGFEREPVGCGNCPRLC